jgi:hypothetical protein
MSQELLDRDEPLAAASRMRALALWLGFAVAFSPVLLDLLKHMGENPWSRYALLFPLLFVRTAWREPRPLRPHRDGMLWVAVGLAMAVGSAFMGMIRFGRAGLLCAAIGLCRQLALASPRTQLLLVFSIPLPATLVKLGGGTLPPMLLAIAAGALGALGLDFDIHRHVAVSSAGSLLFGRFDSGVALMPLLAGLSWYDSLMLRRPLWSASLRAGATAFLAFPLQVVAIGAALLVLASGDAALARRLLSHAPWLLVALVAIARTEQRVRRGALA